ncbi:hypothetical protein OJF2_37150 [Aquisphaera giovannonii]|uniref:Uncharacterized protein n=1 Tax=Aquisphaera giovannonii TaxID=406548 RepID=A0A5B9W5C2_9BACT|nr:hypothetical protein [Aquisphaera giovannonii]QEH35170.1 hypothetical protein OJF2_37150 [Aquisphaera giovannonii]
MPAQGHAGRGGRAGAVVAGKYALLEPIGEGGMGSVRRHVAVKRIKAPPRS